MKPEKIRLDKDLLSIVSAWYTALQGKRRELSYFQNRPGERIIGKAYPGDRTPSLKENHIARKGYVKTTLYRWYADKHNEIKILMFSRIFNIAHNVQSS